MYLLIPDSYFTSPTSLITVSLFFIDVSFWRNHQEGKCFPLTQHVLWTPLFLKSGQRASWYPVVESQPCSAGDTSSIPGPGGSHWAAKPMCHSYWAHALQLLKPTCPRAHVHNKRSAAVRSLTRQLENSSLLAATEKLYMQPKITKINKIIKTRKDRVGNVYNKEILHKIRISGVLWKWNGFHQQWTCVATWQQWLRTESHLPLEVYVP